MTVLVRRRKRWTRSLCGVKLERTRRIGHAFVRIDLCACGMRDRDELQAINVENFFKLVGDAKFKTPVALLQLVTANADVLIRVGRVVVAGRFPVAHLTAAHEIRDELKTLAVPRVRSEE